MDKVPDLRVLGEKRQGKKTAAWGSTDSDKVWEVSATGPVTVSVGENSPLFWPRSSEPTRAINPCRSGLQQLPAMSVLGSVPGCQDRMLPNIFINRYIIIVTIFILHFTDEETENYCGIYKHQDIPI